MDEKALLHYFQLLTVAANFQNGFALQKVLSTIRILAGIFLVEAQSTVKLDLR